MVRTMELKISQKAQSHLDKRQAPLYVELELYFSCLIRKRVLVHDEPVADGILIPSNQKNLLLQFRPVMTKSCSVQDVVGDSPDLERFPIKRAERFFPKWVKIDFKKGKFWADFGYQL